MARLTKADRQELRLVLANAERAYAYLAKDKTVIATRKAQATTCLDYRSHNDTDALTPVDKWFGSDLTGLSEAIRRLSAFLVTH